MLDKALDGCGEILRNLGGPTAVASVASEPPGPIATDAVPFSRNLGSPTVIASVAPQPVAASSSCVPSPQVVATLNTLRGLKQAVGEEVFCQALSILNGDA